MRQFIVSNTHVKPLAAAVLLILSGEALLARPVWAITVTGSNAPIRAFYDGLLWYADGTGWWHPDPITGGYPYPYPDGIPLTALLPGLPGEDVNEVAAGYVEVHAGDGALGSTGGRGGNASATATGDDANAFAIGGLSGWGYSTREFAPLGNAIATATGGKGEVHALSVGNYAEATAYGEGKQVSAEGYGKEVLVSASGFNLFKDIDVVATQIGANGFQGVLYHGVVNYDIDAVDAEVVNAVSGGSGGLLHLVQNAFGGSGGVMTYDDAGNPIGMPGYAGNARSSLSGYNSLGNDIRLESNAFGGMGGGSNDYGLGGGRAIASAEAEDTGNIAVYANASGGTGGSSKSRYVGWGGVAELGRVYGSSTTGGQVLVSGQASGGEGGSGLWIDAIGGTLYRSGGWGRSVYLDNAVDGDTTGDLKLRQVANGGAAGFDAWSGVTPRTYGAGSAFSSLSKTTASEALEVESRAYSPGAGGDATAKASAINTERSASASSWAGGCTNFFSMYDCVSGSAEASATARGMDKAKALASAKGSESGFVYADAGSFAGTSKTLSARAYAGAELPKYTSNTAIPGMELQNMGATAAAGVYIAPSDVSDIDDADDKQAAAYVVTEPGALVALIPEVDNFFATGNVGAIGRFKTFNDGHQMSSAHIDLSFDLTDLNLAYDPSIPGNNPHLMLMFLNPTGYGSGMVDDLNLSITVAGHNVFSKSAENSNDAAAYLSGGVLDLAELANGLAILPTNPWSEFIDQKLDVGIQLSLLAAADWGGLSFDFALGIRPLEEDIPTLPVSTDSIILSRTPPRNFPGAGYALYGLSAPPEVVPVPSAIWLMASGIAILFGLRGRQSHNA